MTLWLAVGRHWKIGAFIFNSICALLDAAPKLVSSILTALGSARGCGPGDKHIKIFRGAILGVLPVTPELDPHCQVEVDGELLFRWTIASSDLDVEAATWHG
eukprot:851889-Amphidinium_carterae.1